tara:strand:- start:192 stop:455 length:264 start_codon:yes stop_codon:yes gene_type:complete
MRIFIYKLLITLAGIYILFQLTIGLFVNEVKKNISKFSSSENISLLKDKIREEIRNGIEKEKILNESDSILLKKFIEKISKEININN